MIIIKDKVKKKLDKLNISKSPGPDGIHSRVLKEVSMSLCTPLARIFETSIKTGLNYQKIGSVQILPPSSRKEIRK